MTSVPVQIAVHWDALRALALLYVEESGVPIFVPGDVLVIYAGHRTASDPLALALAWLVAVLAVTLGASNLYLLARWLGRRLVSRRPGLILDLAPGRPGRARETFPRWGPRGPVFRP